MVQYKIKDLETLSGIKAHTIRMWEKRYDLLQPQRTDTQIRFYTEEDLKKLLNVSILYKNGYKISKISKMNMLEIDEAVSKIKYENHCCNTDVSLLIESAIGMKCNNFNQLLSNIIDKKGMEEAFSSCINDFFIKIESLWKGGKVTHAQKHFVYNIIRQKIIVETEKFPHSEKNEFDALLFTPEGGYNEISLLYFNYLLRKKEFNTIYLGVKLPIKNLEKTLLETQPKRIVTSIIDEMNEQDYIAYLDELEGKTNIPIYIGGNLVNQYGLFNHKNIFRIEDLIQ